MADPVDALAELIQEEMANAKLSVEMLSKTFIDDDYASDEEAVPALDDIDDQSDADVLGDDDADAGGGVPSAASGEESSVRHVRDTISIRALRQN